MSTDFVDSTLSQVRDVIDKLQRPVPDLSTLLTLLTSPLHRLGLLPPRFQQYNTEPLPDESVTISKHIPPLQRALLQHIYPTWDVTLAEQDAVVLLEQYFCPDSFSFASSSAGNVALLAYSTIMSQPLTEYSIQLLARLSTEYPVDRLYSAIFLHKGPSQLSRQKIIWEDCIRNLTVVPGKIANHKAGKDIPPLLQHGTYFNSLCVRCESLIASLSLTPNNDAMDSVSYLLAKLVNLGIFPQTRPISRSQPSFFMATRETIRDRLKAEDPIGYSKFWTSLMQGLPSSHVLQSILRSLIGSFPLLEFLTGITSLEKATIKREARFLTDITGYITPEKDELWDLASAIILGREWSIGYARIFVCWVSGGCYTSQIDVKAINALLHVILDTWSSADHIKHSLLSHHQYVTSLLLLGVSYLPPSSEYIQSLSFSPVFISAIGRYVSHLDPSVRRCGMLAAEVVAQLSGKKLDFKDWDGNDPGKNWAREIRELIKQKDVDSDLSALESVKPATKQAEETLPPGHQTSGVDPPRIKLVDSSVGYDSDDSVTGYASPLSSRSASPTPSELDELEKEPTLNVGVKKVARPVYLAQLGEIFRGTGGTKQNDEPHEADKIEMGLNCAEELIRKKRAYGTELDENAVNLVYGLIGLQDKYDLEAFEAKRQNAMSALIACCPRQSAPALIEEFFKNQYSTSQRYVALNALALGARELASLPLPPSTIPAHRISFPSKTLPPPLHQRYIAMGKQEVVPLIMDSISDQAIERGKDATTDKVPEIVRERRLRVQKPKGIAEISSAHSPSGLAQSQTPKVTSFTEVATEFFIAPLINRFWLFLRDEQTREERTAHYEGRQRYHGAGTGLILNAVVLSHFLRTLAILVHASQNAPEWLAVVAPDALELAVTLGTKPISHMETDTNEDSEEGKASMRKEASVLTTALELTLVVLDGCLEIDEGRSIGLEHTVLLLGAGEWAGGVFSALEKGLKAEGGGGLHEIKLRRVAAGVVLKVDELTSKWRRSMLDTR